MASAIIGGKRRIARAELQKKGKQDEKNDAGMGSKKPAPKKSKKKSAY